MTKEILIVQVRDGYRLAYGYLRLALLLSLGEEVLVEVWGAGPASVVKSAEGLRVLRAGQTSCPLFG